jgi:hypothetical protein
MNECDALIHCAALISVNGDPVAMFGLPNAKDKINHKNGFANRHKKMHISVPFTLFNKPHLKYWMRTGCQLMKGFAYEHSKLAGQKIALEANERVWKYW